MTALILPEFVELDLDTKDREEATRILVARLAAAGRVSDLDGFLVDLAAREAAMPTGLEGGIAVPHARSAHVVAPTLGFARSVPGIDWGAADGPAHLIFLIAAPADGGDAHMAILSKLARKLIHASFTASLREAADPAAVVEIVAGVVGEGSAR